MERLCLRPYRPSDCPALARLFYETVHTVNRRDYTPRQLDAWAPEEMDLAGWDRSFRGHFALVAELEGRLAGFGDICRTGYLDRLYVGKDCQGQGGGFRPLRGPGRGLSRSKDHHLRLHHRQGIL